MNLAYYGHALTIIQSFSVNDMHHDTGWSGGIKFVYEAVDSTMKNHGHISIMVKNTDHDEFRRDYYGMHRYENDEKISYYAASRYLGYKAGKTTLNILSIPPENPDLPADILYVWDEGYGGLSLPENNRCVLWASDKSLPDRQEFGKIASKCLLILDAGVLRRAGAMISRQISWERTASELIQQMQNNPEISYLLNARYILITFEVDGAVFIMKEDDRLQASLILTHGGAEGTTIEKSQGMHHNILNMAISFFSTEVQKILKLFDGDETTVSSALTGSMFREIPETGENLISSGFLLDNEGYFLHLNHLKIKSRNWDAFSIPLKNKDDRFLYVPDDWTITSSVGNKIVRDVAFDYVVDGAKVIDGLPQLSLGALTTVDRWEIEAYQNIRNLILSFAKGETTRPLSIAVFGAPGAGKSFGVTQIAKNIMPGKVEKLEFNVSQFVSLANLSSAFHKVRDVVLEGKLPLVFFDEFDSGKDGLPLGWVKSFLMPMQDGRFIDESGEHPLGKCILVFAGGTATSFEDFSQPMYAENADERQNFKNIKGPDFVSRLKGTINILGPNQKNKDDKNYILRRALLLRSLCERKFLVKNGKASISPSVINAMLLVPEYKHGARSMEAILDMSRIDSGILEPASLPFRSQLSLHVDADIFMRLILNGKDSYSDVRTCI